MSFRQNKKNHVENKHAKAKTEETAAQTIQKVYKGFLTRKIKIIQSGSWITGSDGAMIFPMLAKTNLALTPTGELLSQKIAPLCGELSNPRGIGIIGTNMNALSGMNVPNVLQSNNKQKKEPDCHFETSWAYANAKRRYASSNEMIEHQKYKLQTLIRNTTRNLQQRAPSTEYEFVTLVTLLLTALQLQQLDSASYIELQHEVERVAKMVTEKGSQFWEPLIYKYFNDHYPYTSISMGSKHGIENIPMVRTMRENIQTIVNAFSSIESKIKFTADDRKKLDSAMEKKQNFPVLFLSLHSSIDQARISEGNLTSAEIAYGGQLTLGKEIKMIVTDAKNRQNAFNFLKDNNLLDKVFLCEKEKFLEMRLCDLPKLFERDSKKQVSKNDSELTQVSQKRKLSRGNR